MLILSYSAGTFKCPIAFLSSHLITDTTFFIS
jgi:hypothetical protein